MDWLFTGKNNIFIITNWF